MAFNVDPVRLRNAASSLDEIKNQTLNALGRYVTMNQDLGATAHQGIASIASIKTSEEVATTGRHVSSRFDQVIQAMQIGANEYENREQENMANIQAVSTQA